MTAEPVRVFAGCDPNDCDLEQMMVLEHSLRSRCSLPVELHWMRLSRNPTSPWYSDPARNRGWRTERWATPFSGFRWGVPAACGYQGRAIYMDTDTVVLCDLAELWRAPITAPAVFAARKERGAQRFCVMLWDCAAAQAVLPEGEALRADAEAHRNLSRQFAEHPERVQAMDPAFNAVDGDHLPIERIKVLHYSDMGTQFTHPRALARLAALGQKHWFDGEVLAHPRADLAALFEREYAAALAAGRRPEDYANPEPYGPFVKKSERHHRGNAVTRGGWRGWLTRRLSS